MRWVLTWKSSGVAKARLVALGFQADDGSGDPLANYEQHHEVRAADGEPRLHGE